MTVSTTNTFSGPYLANGATVEFPFTFQAMSTDEVSVYLRDSAGNDSLVATNQYSAALTHPGSLPSIGAVTFNTPPIAGLSVLIESTPDFTQNIAFEDGARWLASPVNNTNDRSVILAQAAKGRADRSISLPLGEEGYSLPPATKRAGRFIAHDAEGNVIMSSGTGADAGLRFDLAAEGGAALVKTDDGSTAQEALDSKRASKIATLSTDGIAAMAAALDADKLRSGYIPTFGNDVALTETVVIEQPGTRIYGDGGPTYNRGGGKVGWLLGATGLTRMFDLGNFRVAGGGANPADTWEVDHLSLKQAAGVAARSIDGISFTSRTNGPDRGIRITSSAFVGLKDAITFENPDVSVSAATVEITGCVFTGNDSAINAKGRVLGFTFNNNQCEQNVGTDGVIRGAFASGVEINDNMLEGQSNAISIDIFDLTGSASQFESARNYFETNSGDYVYRYRASSFNWSCEIGPNYTRNITAADYVLIEDCGGQGRLVVRDPYPVTFHNSQCTLAYGSDILVNASRTYKVRQIAAKSTEVIIANYANLTDQGGDHTHTVASAALTPGVTPWGKRPLASLGTFITVPLAVAAGDLVSMNILMRAEEVVTGNLSFLVYNAAADTLVKEWGSSLIATVLMGKWALVNVAFVAGVDSTSLRVKFTAGSGTYDVAMAAIAAKNMGAFANDGDATALIKPVTPNILDATPRVLACGQSTNTGSMRTGAFGIASISKTATGTYQVTLTQAAPSTTGSSAIVTTSDQDRTAQVVWTSAQVLTITWRSAAAAIDTAFNLTVNG